jgi:hypothetical protein
MGQGRAVDPAELSVVALRGAGGAVFDHANRRYGAPAIVHRFLAGSDAIPETRVSHDPAAPRNATPRSGGAVFDHANRRYGAPAVVHRFLAGATLGA